MVNSTDAEAIVSARDDRIDDYDEVPPRSIFAATWFRLVLVLIVVGVAGAVAIPYVLDRMNTPAPKPAIAVKTPTPTAVSTPPASPAAPEKKDSTLVPAPMTAPAGDSKTAPAVARPVDTSPLPPKLETKAATPDPKTKAAMSVTEAPKPAAPPQPAKSDATAKTDVTKKPDVAPKSAATSKAEVVARADTTKPKDDAKPAVATKTTPTPKRAVATATAVAPATTGAFWVQVGAFKDAESARRLAAKLREENFSVEESVKRTSGGAPARTAPAAAAAEAPSLAAGADQYDVFVSGQTTDELTKRLAAKGLSAEASGGGIVVKPSLPLREAVALSKDLAVEGFKVQVRRAGASVASAAAPAVSIAPAARAGGSQLHRVRVGAFPDRAAAETALRRLEAKGYKPYIARGNQ